MELSEIPKEYNVIDISFLNTPNGYMPEFTPAYDADRFKKDILDLQARGVKIIFSIG
jgi:chitinase